MDRTRSATLEALHLARLAGIATDKTITPLAQLETVLAQSSIDTLPLPESRSFSSVSLSRLPAIAFNDVGNIVPRNDTTNDLEPTTIIGEGGMGRVILARQRSLRRDVAIKTLRPDLESAERVDALLHEAVITGSLEHPNIVPVHALGVDAHDHPIMIMKRIDGVAWRELILDDDHPFWNKLSFESADHLATHLDIMEQICNALSFAHARNTIHRDVKPENVMIGEYGEVYLVDWGIATKAWTTSDLEPAPSKPLVGTPAYMAPEMITHESCTPQTDVYLLGTTLHEVLTKKTRHQGSNLHDTLLAAVQSVPFSYSENVPAELADLCNRATAADPRQRPESALAFRARLREFRKHRASLALAEAGHRIVLDLENMGQNQLLTNAYYLQVSKLFAECRFALRQALETWPDNPLARSALQRANEVMLFIEIRFAHVDAVDSILAEMTDVSEEVMSRVEELRAQVAKERADEERRKAFETDMDFRIGSFSRAVLFGVIGIVSVFITYLVLGPLKQHLRPQDQKSAFILSCAFLTIAIVVTLLFRKPIFRTRANRIFIGTIGWSMAIMVIHRAVALFTREPVSSILANDLLIFTASSFGIAVIVERFYAVLSVLGMSVYVFISLNPEKGIQGFGLGSVFVVVVALLSLYTSKHDPDRSKKNGKKEPTKEEVSSHNGIH